VTAAEIACALGAAHRSGRWWRCICPVHGSRTGHSLSLALRDHPRGLAIHCHAGCSRDEIIVELRRRGLICRGDDIPRPTPPSIGNDNRTDTERRIEIARRIWSATTDARGSPVVSYLADRGIDIDPPPVLRWSPGCWHKESGIGLPAMVARVDNAAGTGLGLHRTYLRHDPDGVWRRLDRRSLGPIRSGAVWLAQPDETLIVGEGIESVFAAMILTRQPGWAALSTSGLRALILPPIVRNVVIVADNDENGAGQAAARKAGLRWAGEGRRVRILTPDRVGSDANDLLRRGMPCRVPQSP
jgi:putative DNA primase/helicase